MLKIQFQPSPCSQHPSSTKLIPIALTQGDDVNKKDPVLQWHKRKVNTLHKRPDGEVSLVAGNKSGAQFLNRVTALHDSHRRQETGQVSWRENTLIRSHSSGDGGRFAVQNDMALKHTEPRCGSRAKDCCVGQQRTMKGGFELAYLHHTEPCGRFLPYHVSRNLCGPPPAGRECHRYRKAPATLSGMTKHK